MHLMRRLKKIRHFSLSQTVSLNTPHINDSTPKVSYEYEIN